MVWSFEPNVAARLVSKHCDMSVGDVLIAAHYAQAINRLERVRPGFKAHEGPYPTYTARQLILKAEMEA